MPDDVPLAVEPGRVGVPPGDSPPSAPSADSVPVAPTRAEPARDSASAQSNISMSRWELLYGVIFGAVLAIVAASAMSAHARAVALAAIGAMAPWYVLVGRPHVHSVAGAVTHRSVIYMTGIVILFALAASQVPNTLFLCIALLPQCYDFLPERVALIPALTMTAIGAASVGYWDKGPSRVPIAVGLFAAISAFTIAIGGYIGRIITQSGERASLIAQLEATRAELAEVSREAGVMAERQRLAGEIHDTLAQGFSSILMLIQAAEAQFELSPTARRQLGLAAQTARENLAEARTLVGGLASAQLQAGTLEDALRRITERTGAELGIEASFATEGAGRRLLAATEVVLLRTGQEALANVRKHAAAEKVAVRLSYAGESVVLEVTDDGAGFDPALISGGYGLRGMRTRVDEAGGNITVRSATARGTSVRVEVPA